MVATQQNFKFQISNLRSRSALRICRSGLTLIELLTVIAIMVALAAVVFSVGTSVQYRNEQAVAKAEIQAIAQALDQFKLKYGDYPWIRFELDAEGSSTTSTKLATAVDLYKYLAGEQGFEITKDGSDYEGASTTVAGPSFIDPSKMTVAEDGSGDPYFVDPWGNAYEYFYKEDPEDSEFANWKTKGFVLLSLGKDGKHQITGAGNVYRNYYAEGDIPSPKSYFNISGEGQEQVNLDNIVYGLSN